MYIARATLLKLDTLPHAYTSECERSIAPKSEEEKKKELEGSSENHEFRIYPNPNNGQMTLEYNLKQDEAGQLNFYNTIGQCVLTHQLNAGTNFLQIELNGVSNGLYSAVIAVNGEIRLSEKVGVFTE